MCLGVGALTPWRIGVAAPTPARSRVGMSMPPAAVLTPDATAVDCSGVRGLVSHSRKSQNPRRTSHRHLRDSQRGNARGRDSKPLWGSQHLPGGRTGCLDSGVRGKHAAMQALICAASTAVAMIHAQGRRSNKAGIAR
eukprot:7890131-Alexandrium_andersonii.AAC.1